MRSSSVARGSTTSFSARDPWAKPLSRPAWRLHRGRIGCVRAEVRAQTLLRRAQRCGGPGRCGGLCGGCRASAAPRSFATAGPPPWHAAPRTLPPGGGGGRIAQAPYAVAFAEARPSSGVAGGMGFAACDAPHDAGGLSGSCIPKPASALDARASCCIEASRHARGLMTAAIDTARPARPAAVLAPRAAASRPGSPRPALVAASSRGRAVAARELVVALSHRSLPAACSSHSAGGSWPPPPGCRWPRRSRPR